MTASFDGLGRLAQVSMRVRDLGRAEAFYRDVLGMKHLFSVPPKMAFFDCAGTRLYLAVPEKPEFDHPASVLYFKVSSVEEAHRTLLSRGAALEDEPHVVGRMGSTEIWMFYVRDTEQHLIGITEERAA